MKDIGEKTCIIQTWEASSFFFKMLPSAFGKPVKYIFFQNNEKIITKIVRQYTFFMASSQGRPLLIQEALWVPFYSVDHFFYSISMNLHSWMDLRLMSLHL